jgi:phosphopantetheinyl transferase (holo-ACP synthase)
MRHTMTMCRWRWTGYGSNRLSTYYSFAIVGGEQRKCSHFLRLVGITNNDWGRPLIIWSQRGRGVCERLGIGAGHVSLTDDAGLVVAFAVVETAEK